nr:hypothetical protein [Tanacetum cinerariifolium]
DDVLREKLLNVNLLISKIEALNANPTPSSDSKTKSSSTSLTSLLEETNTFDNSIPEFETFCFDVEEISSGSTTIHPDISLPEYEAFYDDHVKESDSYEFTDELIPFISAPEYDCLRFTVKPNSRDFTKDVVENISPTKEPQVLNDLPTHPTLQLNLKFQPSSEYLFAYVVWIFLPFLVYLVVPHYLLSLRNEDIIFDLDRTILPWMFFCSIFIPIDSLNIPGFMKILANGFHYLKASYSPLFNLGIMLKKDQENDKIGSKPDKNEKRGEAGKSLK